VFRNRSVARASVQSKVERDEANVLPSATAVVASITPEGQDLLERARDVDLAAAIFRNRVINPDLYQDDEQVAGEAQALTIPARTRRYWRQLYREAEHRYGSGLIGLLPRVANCGRKRETDTEMSRLIEHVLETHYDTVTPGDQDDQPAWQLRLGHGPPGSYGIEPGALRLQNRPGPGEMLADTADPLPSQAHCGILSYL
jgi:hypothetical protein